MIEMSINNLILDRSGESMGAAQASIITLTRCAEGEGRILYTSCIPLQPTTYPSHQSLLKIIESFSLSKAIFQKTSKKGFWSKMTNVKVKMTSEALKSLH